MSAGLQRDPVTVGKTCGNTVQLSQRCSISAMFKVIASMIIIRVAKVREKYLENEFFSRSGKVREFCRWQGKFRKDLESQGKVREFENKWQSSENLFILFKRGKHVLSHEIV